MSNVVPRSDPLTSSEIIMVENLAALGVSGNNQFIQKTGAITFANTTASGSGGGGGLSAVSHDTTLTGDGTPASPLSVIDVDNNSPISISGTINNSNLTFTAASQPTYLAINGVLYQPTGGDYIWVYSSGTITLNQPVGLGGSIFGIGAIAAGTVPSTSGSQYYSPLATTTTTLTWDASNVQKIILANGGQTFTFANGKSGARYILYLKQPASGAAGTVTWPGSVLWPGGSAPTLTATNGKIDLISFNYDGTNYFGNSSLNF